MFVLPLYAAVAAAAVWAFVCSAIDRRNAARETVRAVSWRAMLAVLLLAAAAALIAPASFRAAIGIGVAGLGIMAFGDARHRYLWEEIAVPTLFAVLAVQYADANAQPALAGTIVLGALALLIYFGGQLAGQDPGFGDIVPTAIIGAALGPVIGLAAFAAASAAFALFALRSGKRLGTALPFGPALAGALVAGAVAGAVLHRL